MYSTTYTAEIIKVLSIVAVLFGFEVDMKELEVIVPLVAVAVTSIYTLIRRFQKGGINAFGVRD